MEYYETISAVLQVAILYFAIYAILKRASGSRFGQALMGVVILIFLLVVFTFLFHFSVLALIIQYLLIYFAISVVVIFQPEIRRMLSAVGTFGSLDPSRNRRPGGAATPELMMDVLSHLAKMRIGALVAFERGISLRSYEDSGVKIDAAVSRELALSIFTPPLPLHDGGLVVRNGRFSTAHCIFPVSNNPDLAETGMRHRAAVGLSEETDAIVFVVSEERGEISVASNGRLARLDAASGAARTRRWLERALDADAREGRFFKKASEAVQRFLFRPIGSSGEKRKEPK